MDILRLLEELNELAVERPRSLVGKLTYGLDKEEVRMQIANVRASLPSELKQAVATMRESERIVGNAREDAQIALEKARRDSEKMLLDAKKEVARMLEQAKAQQEAMVSESEIVKLAKAQSEEIRNSADRDAVNMRRGAEDYAYEVLSKLESAVTKVLGSVERSKQEMNRPAALIESRDKVTRH